MMISGRAPVPIAPRWMAGGGRGAELRADARTDEAWAEELEVAEGERVGGQREVGAGEARGAGRPGLEVSDRKARRPAAQIAVRRRELARRRSELGARAVGRDGGAGGRGLKPPAVRSVPETANGLMGRTNSGQSIVPGSARMNELVEAGTVVYRGRGAEAREGGGLAERAEVVVAETGTAAQGRREAEATRRHDPARVRRGDEARRGGARRAEFDAEGDLRLELGR